VAVKILILNRRDISNPAGGGAEIYTHELARGLVDKYQCAVTVLAGSFSTGLPEETIDGVRYIRKGNEVTVHLWGFLYAMRNRKNFDRIIDEFNGIGFFTFFLRNSVLLIHQLYREFWLRELGFWGKIPFFLEPILLRFYKTKKTVTVSPSTKEDLEHLGFRNVIVVKNAIGHTMRGVFPPKDDIPALMFLGRLKSTKRPEDAIEIYKKVIQRMPSVRLWIAGRGPEEERLKTIATGLGHVTFWGWVEEERKMVLLHRAHLLLVPSVREGFGINVIEAASARTPAIGYDVPGLRDSIRDGETGYLVRSIDEAAARIVDLLGDQENYEAMCNNCASYSKEFTWDRRVDEFWHEVCLNI
jgi:glycosyltransferase involved in cell wall biosynthesis